MTTPIIHDNFTNERQFALPAARVFAAHASEQTKRRWFQPCFRCQPAHRARARGD